jgi:hypothetical protein
MHRLTIFIIFILFLFVSQAAAQGVEPTLIVAVNTSGGNAGDFVTVELTVVDTQGLFALQTQCVVDANILVGVNPGDGDVFNAGNSFFVDKGFQADGRWTVAASRLQPNPPFSGSGIAYRLIYQVKAAGHSEILCTPMAVDFRGQLLPIVAVNGSFQSALPPTQLPAPTIEPTQLPAATTEPTQTPPPTVEPTQLPEMTEEPTQPPQETVEPTTPVITEEAGALSMIQGVMTYQNHPDNSGITVQLLASDSSELASVMTGSDGFYSFTDVPSGIFVVTAVGIHHLRIAKTVEITTPGQFVDLGTIMMPGGDTDGNGAVDVADAALIGINFELPVNPAPPEADVNLDGFVNVRDLAIVGGNFGLAAPVVLQ